jgi:hypothetical protein
MIISKSMKTMMVVLIALVLAGFSYAYAAANTVPASNAGDGSGAITGYTITNVKYNLNTTDPSKIDTVTFNTGAAAATIKIRLDNTTTWYTCTAVTVSPWTTTCTTTGATVVGATNLQVVATN